ncbi:MAG: caspase family protein [Verrucomicrobiales bacterium]|nr:caspase family protein [Verrucomicrobiales bacterium]
MMKAHHFSSVLFWGFLLALCATTVEAQDRVALVIGNDAYRHVPSLSQAVNDATEIGTTLTEIGFTVETALDTEWKPLMQRIEQFATEHADAGLAVVYFAGHGVEVNGEHYLIPIDCNPTSESSFEYEAVPLGFVLNQLADHQNCLRVVILDACRNNPFATDTKRSLGTKRGLGARTKASPKQTLIAYSANTGQEAFDGMYTPALLKHLKNNNLRGEEVFYAINNEVSDKTEGSQEPAIYITGGRPFSFHASVGSNTKPSPPASQAGTPQNTPPSATTNPPPTMVGRQVEVSKDEVQTFLDGWVAAWESRDLSRYSNFYADYFAGSNYSHVSGHKSMTRRAWMEDKGDKFRRAHVIDVNTRNASFQTDEEIIVLKFTQDFMTRYGSDPYNDTGEKVLLLRKINGSLKIVNEKFFPPNVRNDYETAGDSGLYSVITSFVYDWADAWQARDLNRYRSFYGSSFQGKKGSSYLGYTDWMNDMAGKFRKASSITVGVGELDIREAGDRYTVKYRQTYKASNYSDVGYKFLTLKKTPDGDLEIVGESWEGL